MKEPQFKSKDTKSGYTLRNARRLLDEWLAKRRVLADARLWPDLRKASEDSPFRGCTYREVWLLYRHILETKPKAILECGSGISTVGLANAVLQLREAGHACEFVTMEENAGYHEFLQKLIPPHLHAVCRSLRSDVAIREIGGFKGRYYADTPDLPYDMAFIDGPNVRRLGDEKKDPTQFDADLLIALAHGKPVTAFLDGRASTRKAWNALFPEARMQFEAIHKFSRFDFGAGAMTAAQRREWMEAPVTVVPSVVVDPRGSGGLEIAPPEQDR